MTSAFPEHGRAAADVVGELERRSERDPDVHAAKLFGLVYPSGRDDLEALIEEVNRRYLYGNALNPFKFVELAATEREVIDAVSSLVHLHDGAGGAGGAGGGGAGGGAMTGGGTESILMSMLVQRERAKARGVRRPQILAPVSAHPAYAKAAHYFEMDVVAVPLDSTYRADVDAARALITSDTAVVVASAFSYPYGIMDPVPELAALAGEHGVGCHVDACIGGFVLPFLERIGSDVPPWDFRVDGVTEMSVDVHKYGYTPKGASLVLHRDPDWFGHQVFLYDQWPSGTYGSPAMAGARPAAPIAVAWAVLNYLGEEGFCEIVAGLRDTYTQLRTGIEAIDGLRIVGDPVGPVLCFEGDGIDAYAVGDAMDDKGWHLNRNKSPRSLHLMVSPAHAGRVDELLTDLATAVAHHGEARGGAARYS